MKEIARLTEKIVSSEDDRWNKREDRTVDEQQRYHLYNKFFNSDNSQKAVQDFYDRSRDRDRDKKDRKNRNIKNDNENAKNNRNLIEVQSYDKFKVECY